ncbi:MAG: hypothetical protein M3N19_08750 [Candidatus Eremiobacteraeota bacterium]|nr:hypothetical protein [Candidatus Eremiobacteraeota bacterium]
MDRIDIRQVGWQFEALLLQQMLTPLSACLGQSGSFAIAPLAQSIAEHDAHGFGTILESVYKRTHEEE